MKSNSAEQLQFIQKIHQTRVDKLLHHHFQEFLAEGSSKTSRSLGSKRLPRRSASKEHLVEDFAQPDPEGWIAVAARVADKALGCNQTGSLEHTRARILHLSAKLGNLLCSVQKYQTDSLPKPVLSSVSTLLTEFKTYDSQVTSYIKIESAKSDETSNSNDAQGISEQYGDLLYCLYSGLDTIFAIKELRTKLLSDESITLGLASSIAIHMASDFQSSMAGQLDSLLQWCSESLQFITLLSRFGLINFELIGAKSVHTAKHGFKGRGSISKLGLQSFLKFLIGILPYRLAQALFSTFTATELVLDLEAIPRQIAEILFGVDVDLLSSTVEFTKHHLAKLVFEDQYKARLFRQYLNVVLQSKEFVIACFWLEYFSDMIISYHDHIRLVEARSNTTTGKNKTSKLGFLTNFYDIITPRQLYTYSKSLVSSDGLKDSVFRLGERSLSTVRRMPQILRNKESNNQYIPCSAYLYFGQNMPQNLSGSKKPNAIQPESKGKEQAAVDKTRAKKSDPLQRKMVSSSHDSDLSQMLSELLKITENHPQQQVFSRVTFTQILIACFLAYKNELRQTGINIGSGTGAGLDLAHLEDFKLHKTATGARKVTNKPSSAESGVLHKLAFKFKELTEVISKYDLEGLIQLVFIKQVNQIIETGFKTCGIVANTEQNEQVRAAFFSAYLDGFHVCHGLFIKGQHLPSGSTVPSSEIFERILCKRSSDSCADIRLTAVRLTQRILFAIPEDAGHKHQFRLRLMVTIVLPRLLDTDQRVRNSAVRATAKSLLSYKQLCEEVLSNGEMLPIILQSCTTTDKLSDEELANLEYLCCAVVFGSQDSISGRTVAEQVIEQNSITLQDARRRASSKIKFELKRHQQQAKMMANAALKINQILASYHGLDQGQIKAKVVISRACSAFIRDSDIDHESIFELVQVLFQESNKAKDAYKVSALECISCLIKQAPKSSLLMRTLSELISPEFVRATLVQLAESQIDASFEPKVKLIHDFYSSFGIVRSDLTEKGISQIENALESALNKFWSADARQMKSLCKLFVTLSQTLQNTEILSNLVSKSINFLNMVKQTLEKKNAKGKGSRKSQLASQKAVEVEEEYIHPLRVAFYSIFLILANSPTGSLDPKVAGFLKALCVDLLKVEDSEVFKYSLGSLFHLNSPVTKPPTVLPEKKKPRMDVEDPSQNGFRDVVSQIRTAAEAGQPYTLPGILFVSLLFIDRKRQANEEPVAPSGGVIPKRKSFKKGRLVASKPSKAGSKKTDGGTGDQWQVLDSNLTSFWRAHSELLFSVIDVKSCSEVEHKLQALDIIKELAMERELPLRNVFITFASLMFCSDADVSAVAKELLEQIIVFDERILNESHQFQILSRALTTDITKTLVTDRSMVLDKLWDVEASIKLGRDKNGLFQGYLSGYLHEQMVAKSCLPTFSDSPSSDKPFSQWSKAVVVSSLASEELIVLLCLFGCTKHKAQEVSSVLGVIVRAVEERILAAFDLIEQIADFATDELGLGVARGRKFSAEAAAQPKANKNAKNDKAPQGRGQKQSNVNSSSDSEEMESKGIPLTAKHRNISTFTVLMNGVKALKNWILVVKSVEMMLSQSNILLFTSGQVNLLSSMSLRRALESVSCGTVKPVKPGLFKFSFGKVVGSILDSFKSFDISVLELFDSMFPSATPSTTSEVVYLPNQMIEELTKVREVLAEGQLGDILQADCGDWKKPEKISRAAKKPTQKYKKGAKGRKKGPLGKPYRCQSDVSA